MKAKRHLPWPPKGERRLVYWSEIEDHSGTPRSTWDRQPDTPEPVQVGKRSIRWWSDEIDCYLDNLQRRPKPLTTKSASALMPPLPSTPAPSSCSQPIPSSRPGCLPSNDDASPPSGHATPRRRPRRHIRTTPARQLE